MHLKTSTAFLSVHSDSKGNRVWAVFSHNAPLCTWTTLPRALEVAQRYLGGNITLSVWDGDLGEHVSEMDVDPSC